MEEKKIIIFGAGNLGQLLIQRIGTAQILYIVDNNPSKWGDSIAGIEIVSPNQLEKRTTEEIIIASIYVDEIKNQLENMGIGDYLYLGNCIQIIDKLIPYKEKICKNRSAIIVEQHEKDALIVLLDLFLSDKESTVDVFAHEHLEQVKAGSYEYVMIAAQVFHTGVRYELYVCGVKNVIDCFEIKRYCDSDELILGDNIIETENMETSWADNMLESGLPKAVNSYVSKIKKHGKIPLFYIIEMETINRCNGGCSFCPVNAKADTREKKYMSDELFENIILQLEQMNYKGRLSLFSNNEPFLDEKIVERHQYARAHLPFAKMHLLTNGTKVSVEQFAQVITYVDEMIIDNYSNNGKMIPTVKRIANYCEEHSELKAKVSICLRRQDEKLSSRGGNAPNRKVFYDFTKDSCALPFQQLVIRPDGKVSLCCNDALGQITLGDLSNQTLFNIWYGEEYSQIRSKLMHGREGIKLCKNCDAFQIY